MNRDVGLRVGHGVIFAIDMANAPFATHVLQARPGLPALREQTAQVIAVASPNPQHKIDNEHGIHFEKEANAGRAQRTLETSQQTGKFRDIMR